MLKSRTEQDWGQLFKEAALALAQWKRYPLCSTEEQSCLDPTA